MLSKESYAVLVPVVAIVMCTMILGCGTIPTSEKSMLVAKENLTSEVTNGRIRISCDVVNSGDPGWITVRGHVTQGDTTQADTKRLHLNKDEVGAVSFEFDIGAGDYEYGFNFPAQEPD
jgi:hypothetical protein